ncbi:MBL fold metallo-hydrolase [Hymenobacter sp. DG25A]|uniref:MBL fold metallo-hydrolase n=1 Tax=Hymenobacter sp. DG25A TaxID=1385663 RepID=UPI0006BCF31F|nr:3',5'-cyclic-nucleotide phosphodiesterase [Hymenobacter sp. DG25A]ALD20518.1 3',5'-cyclic-nucleotide phosphodiesterase [Hymenobacter sp. DG25A]
MQVKPVVRFPALLLFLVLPFLTHNAHAQASSPHAFTVVPLGVKGGLDESNLSTYLVAPTGSNAYVCLDAGSLQQGIEKAIANKVFATSLDTVLRQYIRAYLLSHAHLDHVAGLLLHAPDDAPKPIYALPECIATLQASYFNWQAWPNFGNEGAKPALGKYQYQRLVPGQETAQAGTGMSVRAFPLSHAAPHQSAAFLLKSQNSYLLYLGDTGADKLEKTHSLRALWQTIQPLVVSRQLKAIFIEVSYPNEQPANQLFGHLTPTLLLQELAVLGQLTGAEALRGLPVVITHIKPTAGNEAAIKKQLDDANKLQVKFVFPEQGERLEF